MIVFNLGRRPRLSVAVLFTAFALSGCVGSGTFSPNLSGRLANADLQHADELNGTPAHKELNDAWRLAITRVPLPSAGCFTATSPALAWSRTACSKAPTISFPRYRRHSRQVDISSGKQRDIIGDGSDFTLQTAPNIISMASGSFPTVSGLTGVTSVPGKFNCEGLCGANAFSVQLNTNTFNTAACNGLESGCLGWEQFVFSNPTSSGNVCGTAGDACLFIESWLLNTGTSATKCPSNQGWISGPDGCFQNSGSMKLNNQSLAVLSDLTLSGSAASTGDSVYMYIGGTEYAIKNAASDGLTDLSANWDGVEFNAFGVAEGAQANFNSGTTLAASIQSDDGAITAPKCPDNAGTTGELNNLTNGAAPPGATMLPYPSISFTESYPATGATATCDAVGVSEAAFQTNSGILYDYAPGQGTTNLSQGMKSGTSPSIATLPGGAYEIAFQANTGHLFCVGSAANIDTGQVMMAGTSPSIAAAPGGGFEVAYQTSGGVLYTYNSSSGVTNQGQGMLSGTSPAIAALNGGGYEMAFQANTGHLIVFGTGGNIDSGQAMKAGTSPAIAASSFGGFNVAYQTSAGVLYTYSPSSGAVNQGQGMLAGTSPSIAALAGGGYEMAFQANNSHLISFGTGGNVDTSKIMLPGTSPAIIALATGAYEEAYQASNADLLILSPGGTIDTGQGPMAGTSPALAP